MRTIKRLIIPTIYVLVSLIAVFVSYQVVMTPDNFMGLTAKQYESNLKLKKSMATKQAEITNVDLKDYTRAKQEAQKLIKTGAIGKIEIPKTKISLPIFQVADNTTLSIGVAQYSPSLKMGQGNYILASHNFDGADVLLNRISQLKNQDKIRLSDGSKVFEYQVTKNKVIKETEVEYLNQSKSPILTLIRCEGGFNTPLRRVVVAKLVTNKPITKKAADVVSQSSWRDRLYQFAVSLFALINGNQGLIVGIIWVIILFSLLVLSFIIFK